MKNKNFISGSEFGSDLGSDLGSNIDSGLYVEGEEKLSSNLKLSSNSSSNSSSRSNSSSSLAVKGKIDAIVETTEELQEGACGRKMTGGRGYCNKIGMGQFEGACSGEHMTAAARKETIRGMIGSFAASAPMPLREKILSRESSSEYLSNKPLIAVLDAFIEEEIESMASGGGIALLEDYAKGVNKLYRAYTNWKKLGPGSGRDRAEVEFQQAMGDIVSIAAKGSNYSKSRLTVAQLGASSRASKELEMTRQIKMQELVDINMVQDFILKVTMIINDETDDYPGIKEKILERLSKLVLDNKGVLNHKLEEI